jgi:outer membrane receptor protein involved in Fe transport
MCNPLPGTIELGGAVNMPRLFRHSALIGIAISLSSLTPYSAPAQVLEEMVVTARKVEESLQDVPLSVTVMSGDKMTEAGITKIEELVLHVPNVTMSETGIGTNLYIRGIGSGINQGFEQSVGMYIDGVYHGRAQLMRAPFLDLTQAEVLRGPQVTLLGNNSIAGAMNLTTAKPTDEFEASVGGLYEPDHNEQELTGIVSGPLFSNLAGRLAVRYRSMDGHLDNNILNTEEPDREEKSARLTLEWAADSWDTTLKLERNEFDIEGRQIEIFNEIPSSTRGSSNTGFSNNSGSAALWQPGLTYLEYLGEHFDPNPLIQNNRLDFVRGSNGDFSENEVNTGVFTLNIDIGEHELTAITGLLNYEYSELCDCDFTGANQFQLLSEEDYTQWSQELRISSPANNRIRYMAGLYYQQEELEFKDQIFLPEDSGVVRLVGLATTGNPTGAFSSLGDTSAFRDFNQNTYVSSAFGQLSFDVKDWWTLNLGLRYTHTEKEAVRVLRMGDLNRVAFDINNAVDFNRLSAGAPLFASIFNAAFHQLSGSRKKDRLSWALISDFQITDDIMIYYSAKKGFKSGGFDVRSNSEPVPGSTGAGTLYPLSDAGAVANVDPGSFEFEDEKALALEHGAKMSLADGAAELGVALFYTKFEDLQVSIFDGTLGFNVGNAAKATTAGIEVDGRWQLTDNWMVSGSFAFLNFDFDDFPNGQCVQGQVADSPDGKCSYTGKTNQYVADYSGALGINYEKELGQLLFRSTLDILFTDSYLPSQNLDSRTEQDAYAKLNLRLALGDPDGMWEVALLGRNLTDETIVTYANDTPLAFSQFGSPSYYGFIDRPRTIAVQALMRFQ